MQLVADTVISDDFFTLRVEMLGNVLIYTEKLCKATLALPYIMKSSKTFEPGHEKMCLMSYVNNKGADQPAHPRACASAQSDQRLCCSLLI